MRTRKPDGLPARLEEVRRRFERSRQIRRYRSRIPDPLWASAVEMARMFGINRTAKALRVDYYSLKKRLERESAADQDSTVAPSGSPEEGAAASFLELSPLSRTDCTLELEDAAGAKMRIHWKAATSPDLAALCRDFWNPAS
jgi:hypothetical protein